MNTKTKLISTISVFCMVLAMLVTGVWAVSTANVTLGGTISFKADNVHATVTGTITGTQETITLPDLEYKADTDTTSTAFQSNVEKWSNNKLTFTSENLITMTITVTNLSTERSLYVKVTDNTTTSNINKTFTNTANVESGKEYQLIAEGTITYTMTMKVDKLDLSAEATYAYDVNLRDANAEYTTTETIATLSYSYNESTKKATVTGATSNLATTVTIPETVEHNNETYSVTTIGAEAFSGFTSLTKVTLPNSITSIGQKAFAGCTSLESIVLPSGVDTLNYALFAGCTNLKSVSLLYTCYDEEGNVMGSVTLANETIGDENFPFYNTHADLAIYVPSDHYNWYVQSACWSELTIRSI